MRIVAVTNRRLCRGDFPTQVERIAAGRPAAVLLREPDLAADAYAALAARCRDMCRAHGVALIVHGHPQVAAALQTPLHLRLAELRAIDRTRIKTAVGTSVHSPVEAAEAQALGADRLIAGHIFATACHAGAPGRGLAFLDAVCRATTLPVYAIGGIAPQRMAEIRRTPAAGVCVMSSVMDADDPAAVLSALRREDV